MGESRRKSIQLLTVIDLLKIRRSETKTVPSGGLSMAVIAAQFVRNRGKCHRPDKTTRLLNYC